MIIHSHNQFFIDNFTKEAMYKIGFLGADFYIHAFSIE